MSIIRFAPLMLALLLAAGLTAARAAESCGGEDTPCGVALGTYHAAVPDKPVPGGRKRPAILFFHGAGGLGRDFIRESSYLRPFYDAGYAILAPNGLVRTTGFISTGWSFRPEGPQQRDELAFAKQVIADAVAKFDLDRDRIIVSGFSIGASLVWYLACKEPGLGAAYAPLAGGFWRPHPTNCAGPIDLFHTHGWRDQTVPLEGRPLRNGELYQGDIFEGLQLWRAVDGCQRLRPDSFSTDAVFWERVWSECSSHKQIVFALHQGDHDSIPPGWAERVRSWFEKRLAAAAEHARAE